jgi:hypothetical protein
LTESPSEEEEEEEDSEREYDEDEMTLFIKKFNKFIKKRRPCKGERKEKPMSKRVRYNYGKNEHFIAQFLYKRKEEDNNKRKKFDKCYKKDKKYTKKNLMVKPMLAKNGTQVMRVLSQKVIRLQA